MTPRVGLFRSSPVFGSCGGRTGWPAGGTRRETTRAVPATPRTASGSSRDGRSQGGPNGTPRGLALRVRRWSSGRWRRMVRAAGSLVRNEARSVWRWIGSDSSPDGYSKERPEGGSVPAEPLRPTAALGSSGGWGSGRSARDPARDGVTPALPSGRSRRSREGHPNQVVRQRRSSAALARRSAVFGSPPGERDGPRGHGSSPGACGGCWSERTKRICAARGTRGRNDPFGSGAAGDGRASSQQVGTGRPCGPMSRMRARRTGDALGWHVVCLAGSVLRFAGWGRPRGGSSRVSELARVARQSQPAGFWVRRRVVSAPSGGTRCRRARCSVGERSSGLRRVECWLAAALAVVAGRPGRPSSRSPQKGSDGDGGSRRRVGQLPRRSGRARRFRGDTVRRRTSLPAPSSSVAGPRRPDAQEVSRDPMCGRQYVVHASIAEDRGRYRPRFTVRGCFEATAASAVLGSAGSTFRRRRRGGSLHRGWRGRALALGTKVADALRCRRLALPEGDQGVRGRIHPIGY